MADEERFLITRQDIEELVKWMKAVHSEVILAKVGLEYFRVPFLGESLLLIPECLPNIDPITHDSLSDMVRTLYSGLDKHRGKIDFQLRGAEHSLIQAFGTLGRMVWGQAACKAGEYPDWWRTLLLGELGEGE